MYLHLALLLIASLLHFERKHLDLIYFSAFLYLFRVLFRKNFAQVENVLYSLRNIVDVERL